MQYAKLTKTKPCHQNSKHLFQSWSNLIHAKMTKNTHFEVTVENQHLTGLISKIDVDRSGKNSRDSDFSKEVIQVRKKLYSMSKLERGMKSSQILWLAIRLVTGSVVLRTRVPYSTGVTWRRAEVRGNDWVIRQARGWSAGRDKSM